MAVTGKDKVFVVNENTNTKYGGVDPTGSFQTVDELRGYKAYTALLTQGGEDSYIEITSGLLTVGVSYNITASSPGDDFRNVGGPLITTWDEFLETYFVATGTTPTNYTNGTALGYNPAAPVVTVLENTIGDIWFTYIETGVYGINSNKLFSTDKTVQFINSSAFPDEGFVYINNTGNSTDSISISVLDPGYSFSSAPLLVRTPIEIRVYN
jgi:hypothetical protein